jgi:hypothetical protein
MVDLSVRFYIEPAQTSKGEHNERKSKGNI